MLVAGAAPLGMPGRNIVVSHSAGS
jgi:hypothetical protein